MKDENLTRMEKCSRFSSCSYNLCPLDEELESRTGTIKEDGCDWMQNYRTKTRRHIRRPMPGSSLKLVPEKNVKLLSRRSQKRWHAFYKKVENEPNGNSNGNLFKN